MDTNIKNLVEFRNFCLECTEKDKEYFSNYLESALRSYLDPVIDNLTIQENNKNKTN